MGQEEPPTPLPLVPLLGLMGGPPRGGTSVGGPPMGGRSPPTCPGSRKARQSAQRALLKALKAQGLTEAVKLYNETQVLLEIKGNATILAPTDVAIDLLPLDVLALLQFKPVRQEALQRILRTHLLRRALKFSQLRRATRTYRTYSNYNVTGRPKSGTVEFSVVKGYDRSAEAKIVEPGVFVGCLGRVHVIDRVLLPYLGDLQAVLSPPPPALPGEAPPPSCVWTDAARASFAEAAVMDLSTRYYSAAYNFDSSKVFWLVPAGGVTIFAPSDTAFSNLPSRVAKLLAHPVLKKAALDRIMRTHMLRVPMTYRELKQAPGLYETFSGFQVRVSVAKGGTVSISVAKALNSLSAGIIDIDVYQSCLGEVQGISRVLLPDLKDLLKKLKTLKGSNAENASSLSGLVQTSKVDQTSGVVNSHVQKWPPPSPQ